MKALKIFVIFCLIIITAWVLIGEKEVHKHFILEKANFKLDLAGSPSQDSQSSILFKLGEKISREDSVSRIKEIEEINSRRREVSIIPSDIFASSLQTQTSTESLTSTSQITNNQAGSSSSVGDISSSPNTINDMELMRKVADMVDKDQISANEVQDALSKIQSGSDSSNKKKKKDSNLTIAGLSSGSDDDYTSSQPSECPICDMFGANKYRDDMIAWNIWRSNIQNRIMDDSAVDANYGTIFFFSFKVDKYRNITDIKVRCTDKSDHYSVEAVRSAIKNLNGKKILEYPKGTNRKIVDFTGGFLIGDYAQYSSPSDYNDFEHVRFRY